MNLRFDDGSLQRSLRSLRSLRISVDRSDPRSAASSHNCAADNPTTTAKRTTTASTAPPESHFDFIRRYCLASPQGPVQIINVPYALMKRKVKNADTVRERLETIQATTTHLDALIDRLLQFSSTGNRVAQYQPFEMRDLVVAAATNAAGSNWPQVTIDDLPDAPGDPILLREVFPNLIASYVKHPPPHEALDFASITTDELGTGRPRICPEARFIPENTEFLARKFFFKKCVTRISVFRFGRCTRTQHLPNQGKRSCHSLEPLS